jgi:hypothetical protein
MNTTNFSDLAQNISTWTQPKNVLLYTHKNDIPRKVNNQLAIGNHGQITERNLRVEDSSLRIIT